MKKLFLFAGIMMLTTISFGQSYGSGIGVKGLSSGGGPYSGAGVNYKVFIGGGNALDITVGGGDHHLAGQLLYEWQKETGWIGGLDWYLGIGGTLGVWDNNHDWKSNEYNDGGFFIGADAVIGLDFNLEPNTVVPIVISLEVGPSVGIINSRGFGWNSAFAVRYIIN